MSKGDYAKAEPLLLEARDLFKNLLGGNHPDYATSLSNLAALYELKRDYAKAEPLLLEARDLCKKVLGGNHPDYATRLNNLAVLYTSKGDYTKAEPLLAACRSAFEMSRLTHARGLGLRDRRRKSKPLSAFGRRFGPPTQVARSLCGPQP